MEHILKLIQESRKLMDYASCMAMATGYKSGEVNSSYYSILIQNAVKEIKHMDKKSELADEIVKSYFEQPDKTLEEVFEEYTEDFTQEETERFFANLRSIIN